MPIALRAAELWGYGGPNSNRASRTEEYMALYRAMESARPKRKRLFTDPFAIHFLRPSLRRAAALSKIPGLAAAVA